MAQLGNGGADATVGRSVDRSGSPLVVISGEVDMSNVSSVEAELTDIITTASEHLVFDLSALDFIDSSGIALLLRAAEKTGRLELKNPTPTVQRINQATGLADILHIRT
jgi:stage II sporulation protein AA (anti-sigma F factor antagonist)